MIMERMLAVVEGQSVYSLQGGGSASIAVCVSGCDGGVRVDEVG